MGDDRDVVLRQAPGAKASVVVGLAALVLGPLTIFAGFAFGPLAVLIALSAKSALRFEPTLKGRGMSTAGLVLGILAVAVTAVRLYLDVKGRGGT